MNNDKQEFQRLFEEVERAAKANFTKERDVKEFYGRVNDYLSHLKSKEAVTKKLDKFRKDKVLKKVDEELVGLGEEILGVLRIVYKLLKQTLEEKGVKLPTIAESSRGRVSGVMYDVPAEESLGTGLEVLGRELEENRDVDVSEIPRIVSGFHSAVLDMQYLGIANLFPNQQVQEIFLKNERYQGLLDTKKRRLGLLRVSDYDDLMEIKEALDSGSQSNRGLGFKFSTSYKYSKPSSSDWMTINSSEDKVKVAKERDEYMEKLTRVNKVIQDDILDGGPSLLKRFVIWLDGWWQIGLIKDLWKWLIGPVVGFITAHLVPFWPL